MSDTQKKMEELMAELENLETGTHDPLSEEKTDPGSSESLFPPTGGKLPEHPRGAQ